MRLAVEIIILLVSVALIFIVLSQEGKDAGFGSALTGNVDTYYSRNKGRTKEGMIVKGTAALMILLMVLCLLLSSKLFA